MILYSPSHLRSKYHSTESRISLRSNITRRKANITEKAIAKSNCFFMVGEGGFEPPKPKQQIYSLPHLTALELSHIRFSLRLEKNWSWWTDSNPRPADYKSAALPTELHQHSCAATIIIIAQLRGTVKHFFEFFLFQSFGM